MRYSVDGCSAELGKRVQDALEITESASRRKYPLGCSRTGAVPSFRSLIVARMIEESVAKVMFVTAAESCTARMTF
jgi:hypothetical protein